MAENKEKINKNLLEIDDKDHSISPLSENLRFLGHVSSVNLLRIAGKLLKIPQPAIAKSTILFYKCLKRSPKNKTLKQNEMFLAMACCFLGTKSEESLRQYRDILMVFDRIFNKSLNRDAKVFEFDETTRFLRWKKILFTSEFEALDLLGHILNYEHPYKFLLSYLNALHLDDMPPQFLQRVWNYLNDSLFTSECIDFDPETLACSAIYLAALEFGIPLPEKPLCWHEFFDVRYETIKSCCDSILGCYRVDEAALDFSGDFERELKIFRAQQEVRQKSIKRQLEQMKLKIKNKKEQTETESKMGRENSKRVREKDQNQRTRKVGRRAEKMAGSRYSESSHSRRSESAERRRRPSKRHDGRRRYKKRRSRASHRRQSDFDRKSGKSKNGLEIKAKTKSIKKDDEKSPKAIKFYTKRAQRLKSEMAEKSEITKMPKMEKMAKSEITKMPKMEKMAKSEIIRENGVLMTENKRIEAISVKRKIDLEEKLKEELMNRRKREFLNKKF